MKSRILTIVLACSLAITGCTSAAKSTLNKEPTTPLSDDSAAPLSTTEVQAAHAFHFESGVLPIGEFDPEEVYPNVFNPCEEISAEEFAAIGYEVRGETQLSPDGTKVSCSIVSQGQAMSAAVNISGNLVSSSEILDQSHMLIIEEGETVPGLFTYATPIDDEKSCRASISTYQGHLTVSSADLLSRKSRDEFCDHARLILEFLYEL